MPETALLRTERLTRAFGSLLAVDRVDIEIRRGELRSIIGPNGAGKTTFLRLISAETTPTSGRIFFGEREITGLPDQTDYIPESECAGEPRDFPEADALYRWRPPVPDDFGLNRELDG